VDTGFQQLLHRYDSHFKKSPFVLSSTPIIPRCPFRFRNTGVRDPRVCGL